MRAGRRAAALLATVLVPAYGMTGPLPVLVPAYGWVGPAKFEEPPAGKEPAARRENRLAREKSPYLLQHAHNPVDWFPWGEEAFRKARAEGKPVFLSIGYSTCHWCHVMERESFENAEIARILNESFVAIKVDREERPDVDDVYMAAVQAMTGHGGWPLSAFLTHEGKVFFGGTYFPPEDDPLRGRGFRSLLLLVAEKWKTEKDQIVAGADALTGKLRERLAAPAAKKGTGPSLEPALLEKAVATFSEEYDSELGGFGRSPKFPRTSVLDFLLFEGLRSRNETARSMALRTLDRMAEGGIRDHLAGGFHRYSTDREWTVPHFEKMLYDQALIARTYLDAGRLTGDARYLGVAGEILDYLTSRLSHPPGGFISAEDADSEGEEGKYYVWTRSEVIGVLGEADGGALADYHGVTVKGNFEEGERSVLTARVRLEELARKRGEEPGQLSTRLASGRQRLLLARDRRVPPARDDKVLCDWNGLAISALAVGYQATGEARYLAAAEKAADFVRARMVREGKLLHRFRDGEAAIPGYLEDHAFLIAGLLDLYEAGFDVSRLREAVRLGREMVRLFWDREEGGFFGTGPDHESLFLKRKEFYDGALPSGNSFAYLDLLRLSELTGDPDFRAKAEAMDRLAAALVSRSPAEHPQLLVGAAYRLAPPRQVAVVAADGEALGEAMVREVQRRYLPARVLIRVRPEEVAGVRELIPLLEGKVALEGKATTYVCRGGTCKLPARDLAALRKDLAED